jgi:ethanolamine utilization protein EutQ
MEMKESVFDWTLKYDGIDYIIEGTLEIIVGGRKIIGKNGDIIYIPKIEASSLAVQTTQDSYMWYILLKCMKRW